jgi:acyl dehydratase
MRTIEGIEGLRASVGHELGVSEWYKVEQDQINAFAASTGDDYWLHTDAERAADTLFGSTLAHGLLTLSLGPMFSYQLYEIVGVPMYLNYGFDKVRFTGPLPVGARVRMRATLQSIQEVADGVTCTIRQVFEREGRDKPVCVAESLVRLVTE